MNEEFKKLNEDNCMELATDLVVWMIECLGADEARNNLGALMSLTYIADMQEKTTKH